MSFAEKKEIVQMAGVVLDSNGKPIIDAPAKPVSPSSPTEAQKAAMRRGK